MKLWKGIEFYKNQIDVGTLLMKFHHYTSKYGEQSENHNDLGIKLIKGYIAELLKLFDKETIMQHYNVRENDNKKILLMWIYILFCFQKVILTH